MSLKQEAEMLRNISLFANLDDSKLKLLAFTSEWVTYEPGSVLCKQGDVGREAYVILEGKADIYVDSPSGPVLVATRGQNDVIGETAIMCDVPRTATVTAQDKLSILKVTKEVFMQLIMGSPQVAVEIIRKLALRLEEATQQLRDAKVA